MQDLNNKPKYEAEKHLARDLVLFALCAMPFATGHFISWWTFFPAIFLAVAIGAYFNRKGWI